MRIFFHTSLAGKKQYVAEYSNIVQYLENERNIVYADHILKREFKSLVEKSDREIYSDIEKQKELIKSSDAVIIEGTYPSTGVGYIICYALEQHKNVLVLYQNAPHAILVATKNRLLSLKHYSPHESKSLKQTLAQFLKQTKRKQLKFRFNMMMDEEMNDLLIFTSTQMKISKADYVRQVLHDALLSTHNKEKL